MSTFKECDECGAWCCKHQVVTVNKKTDPNYHAHWMLRAVDYVEDTNGETIFVMSQPCPKLKDNQCIVYKDRGEVCKNFPNQYVREWVPFCALMSKIKSTPPNGYRLLVKTNE